MVVTKIKTESEIKKILNNTFLKKLKSECKTEILELIKSDQKLLTQIYKPKKKQTSTDKSDITLSQSTSFRKEPTRNIYINGPSGTLLREQQMLTKNIPSSVQKTPDGLTIEFDNKIYKLSDRDLLKFEKTNNGYMAKIQGKNFNIPNTIITPKIIKEIDRINNTSHDGIRDHSKPSDVIPETQQQVEQHPVATTSDDILQQEGKPLIKKPRDELTTPEVRPDFLRQLGWTVRDNGESGDGISFSTATNPQTFNILKNIGMDRKTKTLDDYDKARKEGISIIGFKNPLDPKPPGKTQVHSPGKTQVQSPGKTQVQTPGKDKGKSKQR